MVFREKLEEDPGTKTKSQVDAEVSEHRARLIADAEQSKKAESSAKSDSKGGRTRYACLCIASNLLVWSGLRCFMRVGWDVSQTG
jgi:hypothetical protein